MTTIYLSSTYEDLKDYRQTVFDALRKAGYKVIAMEDYVATDMRPVDKCLADVAIADIYVGLFGFRYGYVPPAEHNNPMGLSITELEFRQAEKSGRPYLIFAADKNAPISRQYDDTWTGEGKGGTLIKKLRDYLGTECMSSFFSEPYQAASLVQAAVTKKLEELSSPVTQLPEAPESHPTITWDIENVKMGSPYPGLMHFTRKFAPVFFGREAEVREVLDRLYTPEGRFIIISGNSGSGKSSLVDAGVLPKLEENGLPGGSSCLCVRMVPSQGAHPFDALTRRLDTYAEKAGFDPYRLADELLAEPAKLTGTIGAIIAKTNCDELVLFLDQMEELFTVRGKGLDKAGADVFLSALYCVVHESPLRVIATIRGDFLHHCHQHPEMLQVLKGPGHYPLGPLPPYLMDDIIEKPARRAGLTISPSLVHRIIKETGSDNLPLLAFVLERLFIKREGTVLSETAYEAFNGVRGAIEEHVGSVEQELTKTFGEQALERLPCLFQSLLVVNIEGQPTRRRAVKKMLSPDLRDIADHLATRRLLTTEGEGEESTVSVAHEKLFEAWPALARWIAENRDDLLMVRQAELEAREWEKHDYAYTYLWHVERLKRLQGIIQRLDAYDISPVVRQYADPRGILIQVIKHEALSHSGRLIIGQYLAELGDPRPGVGLTAEGLPDIQWVEIPGGKVTLEETKGEFKVAPFRIARYPVTNSQFQAFVEAADGYCNPAWWEDTEQSESPDPPRWSDANCPRETVSWYEAVAYCRWLTQKFRTAGLLAMGKGIRLPTEREWQQAATGGDPGNDYPWGKEWDPLRFNSAESRLDRTTAVGMYPHGTWPGGPLDMTGNVWEWCLSKYNDPKDSGAVQVDKSGGLRVIRGGSWFITPGFVRSAGRSRYFPGERYSNLGFRLAQDT